LRIKSWLYQTWVIYKVKPVYNGQPRGFTKVTIVDRWPLFGAKT